MNPKSYVVTRTLRSNKQLETQVRSEHINRKRHTDSNPWMTRLQINLIPRFLIIHVSRNMS
jgi:hypothetical protein